MNEDYYHSVERVRWVKSLPCCVPLCFRTPSQNAHIHAGGMGMKAPPWAIVPLCHYHHREQGDKGIRTFQEKYGIDLEEIAQSVEDRWQLRLLSRGRGEDGG